MYQSEFFYGKAPDPRFIFQPMVTSVFKIFTDDSYYHYCDNEEKMCHPAKTVAFIRCTDGEGKFYLSDRSFRLKEGQCIFLNFHDIIKYKSLSTVWGYRWVNFITQVDCSEFELNKIYNIPLSEKEDFDLKKLLDCGKADTKNQNYLNALFLNYFYTVMIENSLPGRENTADSGSGRLIDDICSYIHQKLYTKLSINEVAAFFKISPRRLHQIFVRELEISPKQYILKKKMEEGYRLLVQTSAPINKIAYSLAFSSPYHFTNEFKKLFGQAPSQVRKMEK